MKVLDYMRKNKDWRTSLKEKPYCLKIEENDGLILLKYNQYDNVDYAYTDEEMEDILTERFDSYIKNLQNSVQILDKDVKIVREDGLFEMRGSLEIISPAFHYGEYDRN